MFISSQDPLEKKLFWFILTVVTLATLFSTIFTLFEELNIYASLLSVICCGICVLLAIISLKLKIYNHCYLVLCYLLSFVLLPLLYFFCGGIKSGMPLYFLTAVFLCAYAHRGIAKWVAFILSMIIYEVTFIVAWKNPNLVAPVDDFTAFLDKSVSFFIVALVVFFIGSFVLVAYGRERASKEKLLQQLEQLSKRDSLTDIYNRRYVVNYLENMVWEQRNRFYIVTLNIDGVKKINDEFGHHFGDQVILGVAALLAQMTNEDEGECASRYTGDEFLCVIRCDNEFEAYTRVDEIREKVKELRWIDVPQVNVTVRGSFTYCGSQDIYSPRMFLQKIDELLFVAKYRERDQIRNFSD